MTGIEWTDATWNPATGCSKVSPGCKNCYAEAMAHRLQEMRPEGKYRHGFDYTEHHGAINLPLKWKAPRRVFVNSMSDFFHERATGAFLDRCMAVMRACPQHQFQVLTKRPDRAVGYVTGYTAAHQGWPDNVWLGTSVEGEEYLQRLDTLAWLGEAVATKFVSFEPLLGHITRARLRKSGLKDMQWAIVGGESGPGHRPVRAEWIRDIRDECVHSGVRFFFKQWGGITPKSGGRELDGRTWDEMPGPPAGWPLVEARA